METIKTWVEGAVTYRIMVAPEDVPVRGNAMVSGDDEADRNVENDLIRRLDSGDTWAWFCARVEAEAFGFKGADTLGCCSYNDQADFLATEENGYLSDMIHAARSALDDAMLRARVALDEAEKAGFWEEQANQHKGAHMARNDGSAYDAACREAHAIVEGVIASILEGIKAGEVDEDSLGDRIHEECDNALIYTSDQWVCAYGLRDEEDAIESGMCEPTTFTDALGVQAYLNLRAAVSEHDFSDALAVAQDAAEETTPEESREEVTP